MERPPPTAVGSNRVSFDSLAPGSLAWVSPAPERSIEDDLVRASFRHLVLSGALDAARARELGRVMGRDKAGTSIGAYLDAFSHLGLGHVRLVSADDDRFSFAAADLLGQDAKPTRAACSLALGFVEGVAEASAGRPTLGAEMTCRARGDAECGFSVKARR